MPKLPILGPVSGIALATLGTASAVQAAIITVPTGLNPGDQYRLVFVTSGTRDATSTNIADYNTFVTNAVVGSALQSSLTANGLAPTWTAIGSTSSVNAKTNTLTDPVANASTSVPIYLIDGNKVATGYSDLWDGQINIPINRTESDGYPAVFSVWTGSSTDGTASAGLSLGSMFTTIGNSSLTSASWIGTSTPLFNSTLYSMYGMSSVLTVPQAQPVPEPSSLLGYITLGSLMLGGAIRRAKK
ncbi:MAG: PEP-CTERM sorting domain-containing protein [Microcystis wesenbergii Mw_MB_S_20031200_S109]|uniref:PEP-CTERM sorting domain-containing protein n=1 Tax=Microcystis wesenbergii Mw_MB_S_20031200_S109D TaxID=2486241 RepID=A0A552LE37_9CHRO|nr:MAG: PEP-CTERM sorting domain-containing protein [Microcystis wesenbergii Mw_MB_S_20031200_S109]TRV18463.1 MAG: PEP-CTERM sorting domain-containing protein [Microcystis wesenbergii Mw_MB_S_20031200_S109D]